MLQDSNVCIRKITVASGKGGVGRTMIVANLGIALSSLGKNTIIIDGSLTTPNLAILFKLENAVYTINDALAGEVPLRDILQNGPKGVKIAPAAVSLDQTKKANPERLHDVLRDLPKTDFVLIDAPVGIGCETVAAIRATQEVLLVATPDIASISDCMKTRIVAEFLGSSPIGIVLNRVRKEDFELSKNEIETIANLPILAENPEDKKVQLALQKRHSFARVRLQVQSRKSDNVAG